jgi:hypothetical protein
LNRIITYDHNRTISKYFASLIEISGRDMKKVELILRCGNFFAPRAKYVWDTFFRYYRVEHCYSERLSVDRGSVVGVVYGPREREDTDEQADLTILQDSGCEKMFANKQLPQELSFFGELPGNIISGRQPVVERDDGRIICRTDLIAAAFFYLSAYQEFAADISEADEHGRYLFGSSYQRKYGFVDQPVVNLIFRLIADWLKELGIECKRKDFPGGNNFALVLSHDIDRMYHYRKAGVLRNLRSALAETLKYGRPAEAVSYLEGIFHNPHCTFEKIIELERLLGGKSSFFFVFNRSPRPMDPDYLASSPEVRKALASIAEKGWELGIHGSYSSIMSDTLEDELSFSESCLGRRPQGGRIHYLRFRGQKMFEIFERAGIHYDNSIGFAESPGFRTGFGLPHLMFDHERGKVFNTLEIPLNVMDTTLFDKRYLGLDLDSAFKKMENLLQTSSEQGLCLSILTHNDFYLLSNRGAVKRYVDLLEWAVGKGALLTDCKSIYEWWKSPDSE